MDKDNNNHPVYDAPFSAGGRRAARPDAPDQAKADDSPQFDRSLTLAAVARDARLDQKFLLLIALSAAIATLGLLQSSTAVVIGAMLVSPLLGPIMGIGFGVATLDSGLIKRSLITLGTGIALAILVAMILVWASPIQDVTAELRGRTQPTLLDLGVAVVGGIAGVYAIMRGLSGVMVGVAIATALVPPLSTVGFGLVTGRPDFAMGAGLLFLTNTLAIAFSATFVARLNRFGPSLTPQHTAYQLVGILVTLGILSVPLALSLNGLVREAQSRATVQSELDALLNGGDRVDELSVAMEEDVIRVDGVLLVDRYRPALDAQLAKRAAGKLDRKVVASLVQLRKQTNSTNQIEDRFNQRLTALENADRESAVMLKALMVGQIIAREDILIDPQTRRAIVQRDRAAEGEQLAAAIDRIMAAAQSVQPRWIVSSMDAPADPDQPAPDPAESPDI